MNPSSKRWALLIFPITLGLLLTLAVSTVGASRTERSSTGLVTENSGEAASDPGSGLISLPVNVHSGPPVPSTSVLDAEREEVPADESSVLPAATSNVLEVFTDVERRKLPLYEL
jgi:hypothetical protein